MALCQRAFWLLLIKLAPLVSSPRPPGERPGSPGRPACSPPRTAAPAAQTGPDARNGRQYNGSSARCPGTTSVATGNPKGSKACQHHLHLRQVGAMILAVPKLEQPVLGHPLVAAGRRAIQPDALRRQVIHPHQLPVQRAFKGAPALVVAQRLHHPRQPVVAEVQGADALPGAPASVTSRCSAQGSTWFSR